MAVPQTTNANEIASVVATLAGRQSSTAQGASR